MGLGLTDRGGTKVTIQGKKKEGTLGMRSQTLGSTYTHSGKKKEREKMGKSTEKRLTTLC